MQLLTSPGGLNQLKFGIVKGTTTKGIVNNIFPSFDKNKIVILDSNEDGMQKLRDGIINVYFNDDLILLNALSTLNQQAGKDIYSIKEGRMSYEEYGVIVYHTDEKPNQDLLDKINYFIKQADTQSFANTSLKRLNNNYFQKFLKESDLVSNNSLPLPILAALIVGGMGGTGRFLWLKRKPTKEIRKQPDTSVINEPSAQTEEFKHSLPFFNVSFNNHSNSNSTGNNMHKQDKVESTSMSESYQSKYDQRSSNNQFVDTAQSGSNVTFTQQNYTPEQKQNLAEAAIEVQRLLYQLAQTNTEGLTEAIHQEIKRDPTLKKKLQGALKAGGLEALKAIFNHPLFSIPAETVKGWLEAE